VTIIARGTGPALVLIPGLQGRWEYMRAAVDALSASFRVITFSLGAGELDDLAQQVVNALDGKTIPRATICGVSFGGLVALRVAAAHADRCERLVLASTPPPALRLRKRHELYLKAPWLLGPLFVAETPFRLRHELRAAMPNPKDRRRFSLDALRTGLAAPVSIGAMASRAKLVLTDAAARYCARVAAPTLIITGEAHLDYVVPVEGSAAYERLIANARRAVLRETGHLGSMTRPREFAELVRAFANDAGGTRRPSSESTDLVA